MLEFTTCQMCAKQFIRQPGSIYKVKFAGKIYHFCSYSCYTAAKKCRDQVRETIHESTYIRIREELNSQKEAVHV